MQPPLNPGPPSGSAGSAVTMLPAHYKVVDLGASASPARINNLNHVTGTNGSNVFFYDGTMHLLATGQGVDINNHDVIVGVGGQLGGAIFHLDGTVTSLQPPPGYLEVSAYAINDSGQIAGDATPGCGEALVIYNTSGTGTVVETSGMPAQINDSGSIAYEQVQASGGPFNCTLTIGPPSVYPGPQVISLPANALTNKQQVTDINDDGYTVGYYGTRDQSGNYTGTSTFLYHDGSTQEIDPPGGINASTKAEFEASAINDENWIGGTLTYNTQNARAYVWIGGKFTDLNTLIPANCNWVLSRVADVNDNGYVVGTGTFDGTQHGFLLVPTP